MSVTQTLIISNDIALKPKENVVEYRVNKEPFGFLQGANTTITLECVRNNKSDIERKRGERERERQEREKLDERGREE